MSHSNVELQFEMVSRDCGSETVCNAVTTTSDRQEKEKKTDQVVGRNWMWEVFWVGHVISCSNLSWLTAPWHVVIGIDDARLQTPLAGNWLRSSGVARLTSVPMNGGVFNWGGCLLLGGDPCTVFHLRFADAFVCD